MVMAISAADSVRPLRPAGRTDVTFLVLDGLRRPRRTRALDVALCALGLDGEGTPQPLEFRVVPREGEEPWLELLRALRDGGVGPHLLLISCGGHPALLRAVHAVFPGVPVQVSIAHRLLALAAHLDPRQRAACLSEAQAIFSAPDRDEAVARFRAWRTRWMNTGYRAVASLESDLASCLNYYRFPRSLWPQIRTVRVVERVFREARPPGFTLDEPPPGVSTAAAPDGIAVEGSEQTRDTLVTAAAIAAGLLLGVLLLWVL
jgi:putative transposase